MCYMVFDMTQTKLFQFIFLFLSTAFNVNNFRVDEFEKMCPVCSSLMYKDNYYCCLDCYLKDHPDESYKSIAKGIVDVIPKKEK